LGEFGLLDQLGKKIPSAKVPVGIGDDAAVLTLRPDRWILATTDTLVEEVHFSRSWATAWQIGYKSLAVNLSDVAAMGGIPAYALVSLALPPSLEVSWVESFYEGLAACAARWNVEVVGGDTVAAREIVITVTLLGEAEPHRALTRSAGRPGDLVLVTGDLGASAAGLEELRTPRLKDHQTRELACQRHLLPVPRVEEGCLLSAFPGVGAVIDLSDGLAQALREIARASSVGAEIYADRLPITPATREVAAYHGKDPLWYAVYGGEDYELLFTARPAQAVRLREKIQTRCGTPVTVIGCLLPPEEGLILWRNGDRQSIGRGYDHFQPRTDL
jgi:thiamine-monophosphate kinase